MFLQLGHTKLDVYQYSRSLTLECYKVTKHFPSDERFALTQQIRRAALSVHLYLSEGASRKSALERKRFYEISRGSIIEIDSAIDIAVHLNYINKDQVDHLGEILIKTFKLLTGMIAHSES